MNLSQLLHLSLMIYEKHCSQVVRVAWLWCRKLQEGDEFKPGLQQLTTGKLVQSNFNGSNTFGTMEISSRQG